MAGAEWSTQQLAEFIGAVSTADNEAIAALAAVERAAELLDADAAAIVAGGEVVAAVGYPEGAAPVADLEAVRPGVAGFLLEVPGVGPCASTAVTLEHPPASTLVVARAGVDGLTPEEAGLLRGMARVAALTMRMLRVLDEERAAREGIEELAGQQAALRRVATLIVSGVQPSAVFDAVAEEVGHVIAAADVTLVGRYDAHGAVEFVGGWSREGDPSFVGSRVSLGGHNVATLVFERNIPARVDHLTEEATAATALAREWARSAVGAPINVEGRIWGVVTVGSMQPDGLPPGIERQLADFTELVATAIANAQAREELRTIADEQAALRRVATLVAEAAPPEAVFTAVAEVVGRLLSTDRAYVGRYEADDTMTHVASWSSTGENLPTGIRAPGGAGTVSGLVRETGRPARVDRYAGDMYAAAREHGIGSAVAAPITIEGRPWGVIGVASTSEEPPPPGTEERLAKFTELVGTAIANGQARGDLRTIADEQAALRRVATLVAEGGTAAETYSAVAAEVGQLVNADAAVVFRYERDRTATVVGEWSVPGIEVPMGLRLDVRGTGVAVQVLETRRPTRVDRVKGPAGSIPAFFESLSTPCDVGAPVTVEGQLWGVLVVAAAGPERLPAGSELRIAEFTYLLATAIGNAGAREELRTVADEQAALRRVATLVARGLAAAEIFDAVVNETRAVLGVDSVALLRPESDGTVTVLAVHSAHPEPLGIPVGGRFTPEPNGVIEPVLRTGRPSRIDAPEGDVGRMAQLLRVGGNRGAAGAPIVVEGRPWGVMLAVWKQAGALPAGGEGRLVQFTELVATAVANTEAQAELTASRARIIATADETRRRIERDLHDGLQQRLVSLALQLRAAQAVTPPDLDELVGELDDVVRGLNVTIDELREYARGIHPAILAEGGLAPALKSLARRSALPVELDVRAEKRLPQPIEVAAYYIVSEALANAAKHAEASSAAVEVEATDDVLRVFVRDDGVGGADFGRGSGLVGLRDRVETLGGRLTLHSELDAGTSIEVELPLEDESRPAPG